MKKKPTGMRSPLKRKPRPLTPVRLPAGTVKTLKWDGAKWVGLLMIPGVPNFHFEAKAEHDCTTMLNKLYKKWIADTTE